MVGEFLLPEVDLLGQGEPQGQGVRGLFPAELRRDLLHGDAEFRERSLVVRTEDADLFHPFLLFDLERLERVADAGRGTGCGEAPEPFHFLAVPHADVVAAGQERAPFGVHHPGKGIEPDIGRNNGLGIDPGRGKQFEMLFQDLFRQHDAQDLGLFRLLGPLPFLPVSRTTWSTTTSSRSKGTRSSSSKGSAFSTRFRSEKGNCTSRWVKRWPGMDEMMRAPAQSRALLLQDVDKLVIGGIGLAEGIDQFLLAEILLHDRCGDDALLYFKTDYLHNAFQ